MAHLAKLALLTLAAGSCVAFATACGQKGPLLLPKSPSAASAATK